MAQVISDRHAFGRALAGAGASLPAASAVIFANMVAGGTGTMEDDLGRHAPDRRQVVRAHQVAGLADDVIHAVRCDSLIAQEVARGRLMDDFIDAALNLCRESVDDHHRWYSSTPPPSSPRPRPLPGPTYRNS